jgi:hypothetical protein
MDAVLEGIVTTQKKGGFKAFIRMGDVVRLMTVIPVITFVKGDAKSGDTLISCFGNKNCIARVPRMCLCGKADLDNPLHRCLWIRMAYQRALNEKVTQLSVLPDIRDSISGIKMTLFKIKMTVHQKDHFLIFDQRFPTN